MAVPTKIISTSQSFQDAKGNVVANGFLMLQLSQNCEVTASGGQVTTQAIWLPLDVNGKITNTAIWFNDELSPSGTVYYAKLFGSNGMLMIQDLGGWSIVGASSDLSTIVPTAPSVGAPGVVLLAPASDQTIVQPAGKNLFVNRFEQIRFADQFAGSDGGAKINAADADLGSTSGEIWVNQNVGTSWTTAVTISKNHVLRFIQGGIYTSSASPMITLAGGVTAGEGACLYGTGTATILQTSSGTADIIQVTGNMSYVTGCTLRSSVTRTGGAGINVKGGGFYAENVEINPCWNGIQCNTTQSGFGVNNILMRDGAASAGNWNAGLLVGGQSSGSTNADCFLSDVQISAGTHPFATAAVVLDAGIDTMRFVDCDFLTSGGSGDSIVLLIRYSGGSLDVPRLIRFVGCDFEAGITTNCIELTAYKDVKFAGCQVAGGLVAFHVNGSTNGNNVSFCHGLISQAQRQNVLIDSGTYTYILGSEIAGASQQSNAGFDSILVSANVNNFSIEGNNFNDIFSYSNHPNYNIKVSAGTSDNYSIIGNVAGSNVVTALLSDGGTGSNKMTAPNITASVAGVINNPLSLGNKITNYNGIAGVGQGLPYQVATIDLTTQGAAISLTTLYAVPASGAGIYRVSYVATVTRAATTSSTLGGTNGFEIRYTDNDSSATTTSPTPGALSAGVQSTPGVQSNQGNVAGAQISGVIVAWVKASTTIQYAIDYTSSGATTMQYNLHVRAEFLG